jgi:type II secretory pathway pseudopilin PulG
MRRLHSLVSLRNLKILLLSTFERRRIVLAAIVTVLVLPLLMLNNDESKTAEVAVTTTTQVDSSLNQDSEDGSLEPIILGGPSPIVQDGSAQIAYPASSLTGSQAIASFSNFDNAPDIVCYCPEAPLGISISVQNLNNGRTTTCTNVFRTSLPTGATMLLHTKVFESLANLVDAPIPVTVSW